MSGAQNRPLAAAGLTSYRYPSRYGGFIMIGATDHADALREAARSMDKPEAPTMDRLQVWSGSAYVAAVQA